MDKTVKKEGVPKRDEALAERLLRRVLDRVGAVVDRSLGRTVEPQSGFTTTRLIERMNHLIDERVRNDARRGRIAPHLMRLKIEWGTHSAALPESVKELENEVLAAAIDHINDRRLRTLAPVEVETLVDIFTTGITVDPGYGAFAEELQRADEERERIAAGVAAPASLVAADKNITVYARINIGKESEDSTLYFKPGGKRLSVGRATDCDLSLPHQSVSKIHAAILMNREGTLLVSDTGSVNGTYINGRRINYGEARQLEAGDVVGFGDVEVRFRKQ